MTNEEKFVNELIGYIFAYPDDDYMTMECLCRKLHKYGLVDKKDGFYLVAGDALRKTEPTISKMEQVDEPQTCDTCRFELYCPEMCEGCCEWDSHYEPKDEPQTETEIVKAIVHKMIDDAVIAEDAYPDLRQKMHDAVDEYEPQTERSVK